MSHFYLILALLGAAWFWLDSARARELATAICDAACRRRGVQFLDQTVALTHIRLRWGAGGVRFRRVFRFEYSEEGIGRRIGYAVLVGVQLEELSMGLPASPDDL